ncbi:hypothetical protein [Pseudohongiella acticola]|uniref:hypothetical protein n=1 Tax=Pseudohongiella acticola TaxID=1524254 RepID=UPI0030EC4472
MKRATMALKKNGYSQREVEEWKCRHPNNRMASACYASLVYESQLGKGIEYPLTLEFAFQVDALSQSLNERYEDNDINGFKEALLNSEGIDSDVIAQNVTRRVYEVEPDLLRQIEKGSTWEEIESPLSVVAEKCFLSFLAMWDVEFGTQVYFPSLKPRSIFAMVLPKLNSGLEQVDGDLEKRRDMFGHPVRRLIDLMACIGFYQRKRLRLDSIPRVKEIAIETGIVERNFIDWRDGTKKFRKNDFVMLWKGLFTNSNYPQAIPSMPMPLFVATIYWQNMLVSVDTNSRRKTLLVVDSPYLEWWQLHYDELRAKGRTFGSVPWPPYFNDI